MLLSRKMAYEFGSKTVKCLHKPRIMTNFADDFGKGHAT